MGALDIIKVIMTDESLKMEIINTYDFLTPSQKFAIDSIAWETYYKLYNVTLECNLGLQYENVKAGKEELGDDFYKRAVEKTDKQMRGEFEKSLNDANISIARKAMEHIINEIHTSKQKT
jgi:hypothetical protein